MPEGGARLRAPITRMRAWDRKRSKSMVRKSPPALSRQNKRLDKGRARSASRVPETLTSHENNLLAKAATISKSWGAYLAYATVIALTGLFSLEVTRSDVTALAVAIVILAALALGFLSTLWSKQPSSTKK
jgi:hypothetical protein